MVQEIRLSDRALTLRRRRDVHFANHAERQRAAESAKKFLAESFSWRYDAPLMSQLRDLLNLNEADAGNARWKVQRAIESGELVTIPAAPSSGLTGRRGSDTPRPRSFTSTPSQLFGRAAGVVAAVRSFTRPTLPKLPADDFFEIMAANPGDVLPDGSIAKALSDAQPFEYVPDDLSDGAFDVAARGVRMTGNEPGGFRVNPNGLDVD